jgi:hypothetical protein
MRKRNFILLAIIIVIAVLGLRYFIFLNARHHLLCEVLKPGMSENEVLVILKQTGDFAMNREEWGNGGIVLRINFTDARIRNLYGSFSVVFFDSKYGRAVVSHGSNNPEIICDFYQPSQTVTGMPET